MLLGSEHDKTAIVTSDLVLALRRAGQPYELKEGRDERTSILGIIRVVELNRRKRRWPAFFIPHSFTGALAPVSPRRRRHLNIADPSILVEHFINVSFSDVKRQVSN